MIRILILNLIIACDEVLYIYSLNKDTAKATFEVFSERQYLTANLFVKSFHQCSMEDNCNFVAKNLKTNIFSKYVDEDHLPEERKNFIIFKKNLVIFEKERTQNIDPEALYVGCYKDKGSSRALPLNKKEFMKRYDAEGIIDSSASRSVNTSVIHMLECSIIINVFVEQRTANMVLLVSQAV